ncbi:addiction module toxin, RelE/StbE family [Clostridia bacterium]|nr:addiction module toxin, RelE/StbE family [Clostridia bacterium]
MYKIERSNDFLRDYKLSKKRGYDISLLLNVISLLASGNPLPTRYKDHTLKGNWKGYRECHIKPNWLLIYKIDEQENILALTRTGMHTDLFE